MRTRRALTAAAIGLSCIALVSACSGGTTGATQVQAKGGLGGTAIQQKLDKLYQKAQQNNETKVVVYGPGEEIYKPVYQVFEKRYPKVRVTGDFIFGSELNSRLNQEFASGKHVGSLQTGGGPITAVTAGQDRCQSYQPFAGDYLDSDLTGPDNIYHATVAWPYGIEYNTDKLSKSQAPKGWQDLTKPKWRNKIVTEDLTTVTGTTNTIANLFYSGDLGKAWLEGLQANDPTIAPNRAVASQHVANGQKEVNVVTSYDTVLDAKAKHLPVGFVFPAAEGARLEYHYTCLLKGAPNAAASKLLLNWMLTPEGQNAFAAVGVYGLRPGTDAPPGLPAMDKIKGQVIASPPVDKQSQISKQVIKQATKVFR